MVTIRKTRDDRSFALRQCARLREMGIADELAKIVLPYGATVVGLFAKSQTRFRTQALAAAMHFMRERYEWEYTPIAQFFGRIDGSTAKSAIEGHLKRAQAKKE